MLALIARGHSNHEIARELVISEPTVRTQAAIYALQQNLVPFKGHSTKTAKLDGIVILCEEG